MRKIAMTLFVMALLPFGCKAPVEPDHDAAEFLGVNAASVLAAPTRIEGWNFQRPDGSIASDPVIRLLNLAIARELSAVLGADDTYRLPAGSGAFEHAVGFRVWGRDQSIDIQISFASNQVLLKYPAYNGQPTSSLAGITAARAKLLAIAHEAFPDFKLSK